MCTRGHNISLHWCKCSTDLFIVGCVYCIMMYHLCLFQRPRLRVGNRKCIRYTIVYIRRRCTIIICHLLRFVFIVW